ncbi:MAG: hypothetical protein ABIR87_03030 [Sphingomicrobium sp.]
MTKAAQATIYLRSAHLGGLFMIALLAAQLAHLPKSLLWVAWIGVALCTLILFRRQMRDEYAQKLWSAGTDVAFLVVLVLTMFGDFVHGVVDGIRDGQAGMRQAASASPLDDGSLLGFLALAAFYIGFHIAMVRERA